MVRDQAQRTQTVTHGSVSLKVYEVNRGNRKIYSVSHKEDGKRQLKQFGDIGTAMTWAIKRAKEIDKGKAPAVTLATDEGAIYLKAKQILAGIGKSLDEVAREYADAFDTLGGAVRLDVAAAYYAERRLRLVQRTVPEVVDELLAARAHKSDRHIKDLKSRLGRFKREVTSYIANVTQRDLALWLRGLGLSSRSHDNFRQVLVLLFRFAQKQGYLPEGRTEAEKTEPMGESGEGEIAIFTADEMRRLLEAAGNDVLPYLALGAFAGIRTAEIVRLDWQEVNFETGYIEIKKSKAKTKGRRLVKMQPNLVSWLKKVWPNKTAKPSGPVTPLVRPEKNASESTPLSEPPTPSSPSNQGPENWSVAGRDYNNVKVTQVEPDRVHITYDGGLGTVMLSDLSPELQKRFNYNPVAANQATQQRTQQTAQADAELTAEMRQNAKADSVHPPLEEMAKHPCYMKGVVLQKVSGGLLVQCDPVTVIADNGDSVAIGQRLPPNLPPGTKQVFGKFLLTNYPNQDSMVDGDAVTTVAYRTGAFSYTTTQGSNATVASYTAVLPGN